MVNLSNLFGGDAGTGTAPAAKAEAAETDFLQDLFGATDDATDADPKDPSLLNADHLQADDEVGSIIASMTDLTDLDLPFA